MKAGGWKSVVGSRWSVVHGWWSVVGGRFRIISLASSLSSLVFLSLVFLSLVFLSSCIDDAAWYELNDLQIRHDSSLSAYINKQDGVFIVNEGNFMYDNASLSYYAIDSMTVLNEVFYRSNNVPLGDVAQSMQMRDSLGYVVINNSSKIYIFNTHTFEFVAKITGFTSPREIFFVDESKAYVSDLYASAIAVVDLVKNEISGLIDVEVPGTSLYQHSTEQMVRVENRVFVNCWSYDSTLLVIDPELDIVIDSMKVPVQPNSMVVDKHDRLWVLCDGGHEGNPFGWEEPALLMIDPFELEILKEYHFPKVNRPAELSINGGQDTLYFLNKHVFMHPVASETEPLLWIQSDYPDSKPGGYYSLAIDPHSSELYVADAIDQVQRGIVYRYHPDGFAIDTFKVGINPGDFCFRSAD